MEGLLDESSGTCSFFCCNDYQIPNTGTWLQTLWAWIHLLISVPCLRHYLVSSISLSLCVALLFSVIYRSYVSAAIIQRVVKAGYQYRAGLMMSSLVAFCWWAMSAWRLWDAYHNDRGLASFHEFSFAVSEALTWSVFAFVLWFEKWWALTLHTAELRASWIINFVIFSICEGYAVILQFITKEEVIPDMLAILSLTLFTILVSLYFLVISVVGKTWLSVAKMDLRQPLIGNHTKSEMNGVYSEEVTRYWKAGLLSRLTFTWLNPLLNVGSQKMLQFEDIPTLSFDDSAEVVHQRLESNWDLQQGDIRSFAWALIVSFWPLFTFNAFLAVIKLCVMYIGPLMIQRFIDFSADPSGTWQRGATLVLVLFLAKSFEVLADHQYSFLSQRLGLKVRAALVASVYRKGLRLSSSGRQKYGVGKIVNYMSVDVPEISQAFVQAHNLWVLPFQIGLALVILYSVVGLATLTGLLTMTVIMLLCVFIAGKQQAYTVKIMACKDVRIKLTNEAITNMKIIKLQAWQDRFLTKALDSRLTERTWITKMMFLAAFSIFMLWLSPLAVSVFTFGSCLLLNISLTPGRVFTAIATFRILQEPLRSFPQTLMGAAQALVALRRLLTFFQGEELDLAAVERTPGGEAFALTVKVSMLRQRLQGAIGKWRQACTPFSMIKNHKGGSFKWDSESERPTLNNINLEIKPGMLVAIVGTVGSGKTALLGCLLGELEKVTGQVRVSGQVAYVAQSAWIQNGTIQDNIIFGKPMDKALYKDTIRVCALPSDLAQMPHGDQTEIGERGINLSGGQKQRIQLARAIYQEADIYMLDDIFSAVDAHTGTELFEECIRGALTNKTVLLVTHQVEFLHIADLILVMRDGEVVQSGKYEELVELGLDFGALVNAHNQSLEIAEAKEVTSIISDGINDEESSVSKSLAGFPLSFSPPVSHPPSSPLPAPGQPLSGNPQSLEQKQSNENVLQKSSSISLGEAKDSAAESKGSATLIDDEERATGQVTAKIYWAYCTKVFGGGHIIALFLIQTCWQGFQISSDFWLARSTSHQESFEPQRFITVYAELAIGSAIFVLMRSLLISLSGLKTAQHFFVDMIHSIFHAPMSFFDTTPTGRILSRSSKDQMTVDFTIPFLYGSLLAISFQLLGVLFVTIQVTWQIVFIIVPLTFIYIQYQRYFIASSRELTRLESISEAPIIHHFSETVVGLSTIRAFGHQDRFVKVNLDRLNTNVSINFHDRAAVDWLGFRLESIGTGILCSSALLLVLLPSSFIRPELVGLSLSYGMALNGCLFFTTWAVGDIEQNMVAVERIQQYTGIPSEAPLIIKNSRPAKGWPVRGGISVQGLKLRYRPSAPLVLKGLTFSIKGGEKLGVVGRTGSGKTSLIQALFRLVEPAGGRILIDGVDISTIGLTDLRSKLSIIPQEPTLFDGTVRSNVDPLEEHSDADIWEALEKCQLAETIKEKDEKLDAPVAESGDNWSMGQRQLFCLGRALLKKSRILVLDEATASVDTQTDAVLQRTIKKEFSDCTVVSIAHRIPSVMDSDKVLVLDAGQMKEFGAPLSLLENPSSLFSLLVQEYWNRSSSSHDIAALNRSADT